MIILDDFKKSKINELQIEIKSIFLFIIKNIFLGGYSSLDMCIIKIKISQIFYLINNLKSYLSI